MNRLFDAGNEAKQATEAKQTRDDIKRRAEEAEAALKEAGFLDEKADGLGKLFSGQPLQGVQAVRYSTFRKPGSKWMIEHAQDGTDYVFQVFPLKQIPVAWQDVVGLMIATMDVIFPRSLKITYAPPREDFQVKFYTIRICDVAKVPGWETACRERALNGLAAIDAWPAR